jgi:opacity protein-like surface antigen
MKLRVSYLFAHVLATAILVLLSSGSVLAEDAPPAPVPPAHPWYVGGALGGVFAGGLGNKSFAVQNSGVAVSSTRGFDLGAGLSLSGQVGYIIERIRVEAEVLWQSFGRSNTAVQVQAPATPTFNFSGGGTQVETLSGFVNAYYDFPTAGRFSPYVSAGLGATSIDAATRTFTAEGIRTPGLDQTVFAYQAKLGLSYATNDRSSAFLQYRFNGTGSFDYGGATVTAGGQTFAIPPASGSLSNHSVEAGLRFRF